MDSSVIEKDEYQRPLSAKHESAFLFAQAEYLRLGVDNFLINWKSITIEEKLVKAFFKNFIRPNMQTLEVFRFFINNMDYVQRLKVLKMKPGDMPDDTLVLVQPSIGYFKPFSSVLKDNDTMEEMLHLIGLTREEFIERGRRSVQEARNSL